MQWTQSLKAYTPNNTLILDAGKPCSLSENAENFIGKTGAFCQPIQFAHDNCVFSRTFATKRSFDNTVHIFLIYMQSSLVTAAHE